MSQPNPTSQPAGVQEPATPPVVPTPQPGQPVPPVVPEGAVILTKEELEALKKTEREEAAKDEKDKLYRSIETQREDLKKKDEELAAYKKAEEEAKAKAEEERLAKLSTEQRLTEEIQKASARVEQVVTSFEALKTETQKQLAAKDIELMKKDLIASVNGACIPELITGETVEAVKASFENSVKRFNAIREEAVKKIEDQNTQPNASEFSREIPHRKQPPQQPAQTVSAQDIMNMTPEQFKVYKEQQLNALGL